MTMKRNPIKDMEDKHLFNNALTDYINSCEVYMEGIDHSYYYEGYTTFRRRNYHEFNGIIIRR